MLCQRIIVAPVFTAKQIISVLSIYYIKTEYWMGQVGFKLNAVHYKAVH